MLGWVGLYTDDFSMCKRPDSKRPQALKSRVAAREAERKPHCGRVAAREAERKPHCGREAVWMPHGG